MRKRRNGFIQTRLHLCECHDKTLLSPQDKTSPPPTHIPHSPLSPLPLCQLLGMLFPLLLLKKILNTRRCVCPDTRCSERVRSQVSAVSLSGRLGFASLNFQACSTQTCLPDYSPCQFILDWFTDYCIHIGKIKSYSTKNYINSLCIYIHCSRI